MAHESRYRVNLRLRGELSPAWSTALAGLTVTTPRERITAVSGELPDQAALHGLLAAIRDLGLSLISLEAVALPPSSTQFGG